MPFFLDRACYWQVADGRRSTWGVEKYNEKGGKPYSLFRWAEARQPLYASVRFSSACDRLYEPEPTSFKKSAYLLVIFLKKAYDTDVVFKCHDMSFWEEI